MLSPTCQAVGYLFFDGVVLQISHIVICSASGLQGLRPGSVESLNGGSTDAMKKAPIVTDFGRVKEEGGVY